MESEAARTGESLDAEGRADIMAAVASVAGFVNELAGILAGRGEVNDADGCAADSPVTDVAAEDDPLALFADACLDGLAVLRKVEAATAALKVRLVDGHVGAVVAMEDPASGPVWVKGREMATVA
ncbi:hypothetical protein, partial [Escherichia coli]|uniref:hypothetical protein n=1 Tax=Escherichia coli TaxID=562 RepID=UPI0032E5212F